MAFLLRLLYRNTCLLLFGLYLASAWNTFSFNVRICQSENDCWFNLNVLSYKAWIRVKADQEQLPLKSSFKLFYLLRRSRLKVITAVSSFLARFDLLTFNNAEGRYLMIFFGMKMLLFERLALYRHSSMATVTSNNLFLKGELQAACRCWPDYKFSLFQSGLVIGTRIWPEIPKDL